MRIIPKKVDNYLVYDDIDVNDGNSVTTFKNFWNKEFKCGQTMFFTFFRKEDLTENTELNRIERELEHIFTNENTYIIIHIDENRFSYVFKYEFKFGSAELILKFWKYFYGMSIIIPDAGVLFEDVCRYLYYDREPDEYLRRFKSKGFSNCIYVKGLGGHYLVKNEN